MASDRSDGRCLAWSLKSKIAPLTVSMRVCHTGERPSKDGEYNRGEPVPEFNNGADVVHTFRRPGEQLDIDLEALATKTEPLLKNYTRPGGLVLTLRVQYDRYGERYNVYGDNVTIVGSTKRKRAKKMEARREHEEDVDPNNMTPLPHNWPLSSHTLPHNNSPMTVVGQISGERFPLAGLAPNSPCFEDLRSQPFFAIKSPVRINMDNDEINMLHDQVHNHPNDDVDMFYDDPDLQIFSDACTSRQSTTGSCETPSGSVDNLSTVQLPPLDPISVQMDLPHAEPPVFDIANCLF